MRPRAIWLALVVILALAPARAEEPRPFTVAVLTKGDFVDPVTEQIFEGLAEAQARHGIRVVEIHIDYRKPEEVFVRQFFRWNFPQSSHAATANFPGDVTAALRDVRPDVVVSGLF